MMELFKPKDTQALREERIDFQLIGAEGSDTSVPGLDRLSVETDYRMVLDGLRKTLPEHTRRLRSRAGEADD